MNRPLTALLSTFLIAAAFPLHADLFECERIEIISARTAAIGGPHVALADDLTTLFGNPAGLRSAKPQMSIAELTLGLSGPVFPIVDVAQDVMGGDDPADLLATERVQDLFKNLYSSITLNGPFAFGYVGDGLGFGFFNKTGISLTTVGSIPMVTAVLEEDMVFKGGYAFPIPLPEETRSTLDVGLMLETFVANKIEVEESILTLLGRFQSPSANTLLSQPFFMDVGLGLDAGVLYSWNKFISVGLVGRNLPMFTIRNAYSSMRDFLSGGTRTVSYGYVPFDLTAGIMLTPELGALDRYITDLKILLDYNDILDFVTHSATSRNPILHLGAGVEMTILEILSLRGGFFDGYLSAGLGLDLAVCRLNLALFGRELSNEPGLRPSFNLLFGLQFIY